MTATDVCAVLITYHPDVEFPVRLSRIAPQVGAIVIVDNGSEQSEVTMLREVAADSAVTLVLNSENLGIARALNIGIERATARGYRFVLLMDQDSRADSDMVAALLATYESFPGNERLAIVGAGFGEIESHNPNPYAPTEEPWQDAEWVITSGTLLPVAAYAAIGPFREEFFIDYVDIDYCIRARANGYRVIKTRRPLMSHSIGSPKQHRFLWTRKWTSNHSADRRYYIARNNVIFLREGGRYPLGLWVLKSFLTCFKSFRRVLLYEQNKTSKCIAVFSGWWDGLRRRMGPRDKRRWPKQAPASEVRK
jgi:rhamnosyltransferase